MGHAARCSRSKRGRGGGSGDGGGRRVWRHHLQENRHCKNLEKQLERFGVLN